MVGGVGGPGRGDGSGGISGGGDGFGDGGGDGCVAVRPRVMVHTGWSLASAVLYPRASHVNEFKDGLMRATRNPSALRCLS